MHSQAMRGNVSWPMLVLFLLACHVARVGRGVVER